MSFQKCSYDGCSTKLRSKKHARNHYQKYHSGEIETPEEYLERTESEQRDFSGEEPTTEGHNPEYLTSNDTKDVRTTTLFEHERAGDSALPDHTEDDTETGSESE